MLRVWRVQYLRIHRGYKVLADGALHWDGWPTVTVMGKIRTDGEGAGQQGAHTQHFPEVYSKDGLLIWRALEGMPIAPREVLYAKWLSSEPVRVQARFLELPISRYWVLLDNAYYYVAGRIERFDQEATERESKRAA